MPQRESRRRSQWNRLFAGAAGGAAACWLLPAAICLGGFLSSERCQAQIGYAFATVEAYTTTYGRIARATVIAVTRESLGPDRNVVTVRFDVHDTLKGRAGGPLELSWEAADVLADGQEEYWRPLAGSRRQLLIFTQPESSADDPVNEPARATLLRHRRLLTGAPVEPQCWIELVDRLEDRRQRSPPPPLVTLGFQRLETPEQIVDAIRKCSQFDRDDKRIAYYGVSVDPYLAALSGSHGDANMMVVPVDRRLDAAGRQWVLESREIVERIEKGRRQRGEAPLNDQQRDIEAILLQRTGVAALAHFDSPENRVLLQSLLDDQKDERRSIVRAAAKDVLSAWNANMKDQVDP